VDHHCPLTALSSYDHTILVGCRQKELENIKWSIEAGHFVPPCPCVATVVAAWPGRPSYAGAALQRGDHPLLDPNNQIIIQIIG